MSLVGQVQQWARDELASVLQPVMERLEAVEKRLEALENGRDAKPAASAPAATVYRGRRGGKATTSTGDEPHGEPASSEDASA